MDVTVPSGLLVCQRPTWDRTPELQVTLEDGIATPFIQLMTDSENTSNETINVREGHVTCPALSLINY